MTERENVYGENHPKEEDAKQEKGIREEVTEHDQDEGVAEDLEETRRNMSQEGQKGGMGREMTPKPDASPGAFSRTNEEED